MTSAQLYAGWWAIVEQAGFLERWFESHGFANPKTRARLARYRRSDVDFTRWATKPRWMA